MVTPPPEPSDREDVAGLRAFFEAVPLGQFLLDGQRTVLEVNAAALRLFSLTGAPLRGHRFDELIAPSSAAVGERAFLAATVGEAGVPVAIEARTVDGRGFAAELTVLRFRAGGEDRYGVQVRDLRTAATTQGSLGPAAPVPAYTVAELLMANRLRDLV